MKVHEFNTYVAAAGAAASAAVPGFTTVFTVVSRDAAAEAAAPSAAASVSISFSFSFFISHFHFSFQFRFSHLFLPQMVVWQSAIPCKLTYAETILHHVDAELDLSSTRGSRSWDQSPIPGMVKLIQMLLLSQGPKSVACHGKRRTLLFTMSWCIVLRCFRERQCNCLRLRFFAQVDIIPQTNSNYPKTSENGFNAQNV